MMKGCWHIARVLTGLVFLFSGFVKGIDPWGSAYKITEYFHAWNMEEWSSLALPLSILLSVSEFAIGLAMTLNFLISLFSGLCVLFLAFFTGVTLVAAITNPVTDCGCFGDALMLTNWQTFFKNLVLIALALFVFLFRKPFRPTRPGLVRGVLSGISLFVFIYFVDYSFNHLPLIDFLPYKVGTNLPAAMAVPEGAPGDVYESTLYYRNKHSGEEQKFTMTDYPWQDTLNWEFASMSTRLVKRGYQPPVRDFTMETPEGEDVKDFFLHEPGYTFILIIRDPGRLSDETQRTIRALADYARSNRFHFVGLTSVNTATAQEFSDKYGLDFDSYFCDETALKTAIRSDPGLLLLRNGTILYKWHYNDFPSVEEFEKQRAWMDN